MADPANIFAIDDLRIVTGKEIRPVVAAESDLVAAIDKFQRVADQRQRHGRRPRAGGRRRAPRTRTRRPARSRSVARLMNQVITEAIRQGAGDIYIEPREYEMRDPLPHRRRVPGGQHACPKKLHRQLISRLKISSGMDIAERRIPQDGRFGVVLDGKAVDFRVAVLPLVHGELAVMRLLRRDSIMMSLKDLGFLEQNLKRLLDALELPYGAILVTGPTGSGKSTTLYAAINETNDPKTNLITVEDPVEYRLAGLSQVQVHEKAGLTFAAALRSILRQDPDKVMIGEIRDKETGTIAIEAALTGHLVLSTLHTNDAPSAITRLTEMGIEPFLSASAVTLCWRSASRGACARTARRRTRPTRRRSSASGSRSSRAVRRRCTGRAGCKKCNGIGYKGRMGVHEVMTMSETLERLTVENASADELKRTAIAEGMLTLRDDGFAKVKLGQTSIEEILRVVV